MRWLGVFAPLVCGCFSKPGFTPGDGGVTIDHNIIFVTSDTQNPGDFGSLAAADALCEQLAGFAQLPENTYVAYLSTSTQGALARIKATGAVGWVRPDGKPVANTVQSLANGSHFYPPRLDEKGRDQGEDNKRVATGTLQSGAVAGAATCNDYADPGPLVEIGYADATGRLWTEYASNGCSTAMRIYCLGTELKNPVAVTRDPATRLAFISPNPVVLSTKRPAFDRACQDAADAAGKAGTFLAAVPVGGEAIKARFPDGAPWTRIDGVEVIDGTMTEQRAPFLDLTGQQRELDVLGGANSFSAQPASTEETCNDWSDTTMNRDLLVGDTLRSLTKQGFSGIAKTCTITDPVHVYCLQQ